jgi:hypothetical protein
MPHPDPDEGNFLVSTQARRAAPILLLAVAFVITLLPLTVGLPGQSAAAPAGEDRSGSVERRKSPTKYGASVPAAGVPWRTAVRRSDQRYGGMETVRVYEPFVRDTFNRLLKGFKRPVVVSFREMPNRVLSGAVDNELRTFFRHAPKNRPTYWSYFHEPEDDAERGLITAAKYRAAWRHINKIAHSVGNPRLRSTLILMCWTARSKNRTVNAYYPGDFIDIMAWDCYSPQGASNYMAPRKLMGPAFRATHRRHNKFAVAELGSVLIRGDADGHRRAKWLRKCGRYTDRRNAVFVSYWDSQGTSTDFRLHDEPSRRAWRDVIDR